MAELMNQRELLDQFNRWVMRFGQMVGKERQAYEQIRRLIQREVSEEFVEKKVRELFGWSADPETIKECENFIRLFIKELGFEVKK